MYAFEILLCPLDTYYFMPFAIGLTYVFIALALQGADPSAGPSKVRGANLPLEYDFARLTQDIVNPHPTWEIGIPGCKWKGVICRKETLLGISWSSYKLSGRLHFRYLPQILPRFMLDYNQLSGEMDIDTSPTSLVLLNLDSNNFSGSVHLDCLPPAMQRVYLLRNLFSGEIDFSFLPQTLTHLDLSRNHLRGAPNFELLSSCSRLQSLDLSFNCFSGLIKLDSLPSRLESLHLDHNQCLYGDIETSLLPENLFLTTGGTNVTKRK